jgi:hypothetical protein
MSDPRYTDLEPRRRTTVDDGGFMGLSSGMILGILAVLIVAGGLLFYWNRDTSVASRSTDGNTGTTITRSAPTPAPSPSPAPSTTPARP